MKSLKYIGTSLSILLLIFLAFAYLQDKEVYISRSTVINAPMEIVFEQFNDLEKRLKWSPWEAEDSTMVATLGDITKGVGANYSWTTESSGDGSLRYTEVVAHQLIQSDLYFGLDEPSQELLIFKPVADGIHVTWEVRTNLGNHPLMRIMGRYMEDMVAPFFESGLASVKQLSEQEFEITMELEKQMIDSTAMDTLIIQE